ncbi:MAG TPA: WD40 repeat domain-containing serine/threonine-protein kinase, partial [Rhodanobacteraceae bacterium]|nr:WD40 repeat domain-containing serine/threonine-protein kinase [Rhodanobacteraceae bacterium]
MQSGSPAGGVPGELCGLAELAFGSLSRYNESGRDQHLALLHTEALELDLTDPAQRQFGDYELLERIGQGGMGVVYRARHVPLDRIVAVKLLSAGPWASPEFITRFEHEARNAARMQHPHIVTVFEAGSCDGLQFFSMRLVEGHSLSALLKRGERFAPRAAAMLLRTVAEAVAYAHSLDVLHLDLKPGNVLIDANGVPHVADFGLARRLGNALTIENDEVSGTPAYMAPEQTRTHAQKLTPATDIWGMGVILYELLTGTPPFRADSAPDTLRLVAEGQVRAPRRWRPNLPLDLQAIVMKCLRKDSGERYASARALADDLARFIEGRPVRARPLNAVQRVARWTRREPKLAATIACAIAALVVGLIATSWQWHRADANAHVAKANAALASQHLWQARIDQAQVAVRAGHNYDALPGLAANIREREAQGLDAREDRVRIAMVERGAPRLIDAIAMGSTIYGVALSPDGAQVAAATEEDQTLRVFDTATGKQLWQARFAGTTHFQVGPGEPIYLEVLRYSADGRYLIGRNHVGTPTLQPTGVDEVLFDALDGKVLVPPARIFPKFRDATYSPDGAYAAIHTTDLKTELVRTSDWQALGPWRTITGTGPLWLLTTHARYALSSDSGFNVLDIRDPRTLAIRHSIRYTPDESMTTWASSPDGETVLLGHKDGQIDLVDCSSGQYKTLSPSTGARIGGVAFSPDGRWFGAVSDSGEVLVWDAATGKLAAPMMHLDITPESHHEQLFIDAASRTVIASADMEMGLWYLPDSSTAPVLLSGEFPHARVWVWWNRAFAYRPAQGLIASDGGEGNLFLWRVQQLAPRGLRAPAMPPDRLHVVDGDVVAVDGASMRVVNPANGRPVGPELKLPQPPAFAELSVNHASLVAVAGREIHVYDAATWKLRRAPIVLPDDPARVMLSPDARHVLLLF